ncbi:MAG: hypothetical protein HUU32_13910 [Calditrichaceae bacterium]|nr:dockerin type I domain-containing protein [Calditrichia bacterium]NUQ42481.1 hypothetical protein [Calditrichaceae bacterium]
MKTIYITIFTLLLALPGTGLYAQPTYDLQFRLEQNEATVNGIYEVTAQIKANVDTFRMGSSNLVFTYNTAALSSPDPIGPGPDTLQIQAIHNFSGGGDYAKITLTEPAPGRMSLNIELFEPDSGAIVPMSFVDIATIRFTIEDETELSNLAWRSESPNPLTLFQNDEATVLNSASLADEVLLADLKVFLEGPYSGGSMSTTLNTGDYLPLEQPFNTAPWNYAGTESVAGIPAGVVDWVLVQIRSDETTEQATRAAFLKSDGMIVDLNGTSPITFDVPDNNYYMVIYHRNHLAIMSAAQVGLNEASTEAPYDFTTGQAQAYGTNPMKNIGGGSAFGMFTGDANSDGQVTSTDFNIFSPDFTSAQTGYLYSDWNMDGQVTSTDFNMFSPNFTSAAQSQVPSLSPGDKNIQPYIDPSQSGAQSVGESARVNRSGATQSETQKRIVITKEKSNER